MPMPPFPPTLDVPLVGAPFTIVNFYPTVIVQCQCESKPILVLIGTANVVTCPACKYRFVIADRMKVQIGAMLPDVVQ